MTTRKNVLFTRSVLVLSIAVGALALIGRTPILEAQGRPDLEAQHQRLLPLFELSDVVFTDADEARGRLVVGVLNRRGGEGQVRGRLRALGIDSQSVDVVETEPIFALATLRDFSENVGGGLQIRFSGYLCSLGFPALRNGVLGFVTASHCSDNQGAVDGTSYYQPLNQVTNELIGNETVDPPYVRNSGGCPKGRKCRWSDANFSRATGSRAPQVGVIARTTGFGSLEINDSSPTFDISDEAGATMNATVNKVGRTTGWTWGSVTNTCANTGVQGTSIVLLCQVFVTSLNGAVIVAGGDSGSPAFTTSGGTKLVGGLWGGNQDGTMFVYSPIANIRTELGNLTTH
jgi:hypothetical protein